MGLQVTDVYCDNKNNDSNSYLRINYISVFYFNGNLSVINCIVYNT